MFLLMLSPLNVKKGVVSPSFNCTDTAERSASKRIFISFMASVCCLAVNEILRYITEEPMTLSLKANQLRTAVEKQG